MVTRKERILQADNVASRSKTGAGTVNYHYRDMCSLRDAVVRFAIDTRNLLVIGKALMERHPLALAAPVELRKEAAAALQS
jgi:AcrR family transcriptional regulator